MVSSVPSYGSAGEQLPLPLFASLSKARILRAIVDAEAVAAGVGCQAEAGEVRARARRLLGSQTGPRTVGRSQVTIDVARTPIEFVVDDNISVRESLEALICNAGWQVETFESA